MASPASPGNHTHIYRKKKKKSFECHLLILSQLKGEGSVRAGKARTLFSTPLFLSYQDTIMVALPCSGFLIAFELSLSSVFPRSLVCVCVCVCVRTHVSAWVFRERWDHAFCSFRLLPTAVSCPSQPLTLYVSASLMSLRNHKGGADGSNLHPFAKAEVIDFSLTMPISAKGVLLSLSFCVSQNSQIPLKKNPQHEQTFFTMRSKLLSTTCL